MFIKCLTKSQDELQINIDNLKEVQSKANNYIHLVYKDGTSITCSYNPNVFSFKTDHVLDIKELNSLITEVHLHLN